MKKKYLLILSVVVLLLGTTSIQSYSSSLPVVEEDTVPSLSFSLNADIVSRYIWRGLPLSQNPNIQPYASMTYRNVTFGAWGSYAISEPYAEVDLFLSWDVGAFTLTLNDYYNEDETDMSVNNYFQFSDRDTIVTPHSLEGQITFNGTDGFPLSLTLATFFYGNDRNEDNKNYFSTYLELGYEHSIGENTLSWFLGGTVNEGFYADKAAVVNMGVTASRELKFSESFTMPVSASLILNPDAKDIFFVFSLTF